MRETGGGEVTIGEMAPAVLRSLVHFLYTDELDPQTDFGSHCEGLLAAADQYAVPRLVAMCERALAASMTVSNAVERLVLADQHRAVQLKQHCLHFISKNPSGAMASDGWQLLGTQPNLLQELFAHSVRPLQAAAAGTTAHAG